MYAGDSLSILLLQRCAHADGQPHGKDARDLHIFT